MQVYIKNLNVAHKALTMLFSLLDMEPATIKITGLSKTGRSTLLFSNTYIIFF